MDSKMARKFIQVEEQIQHMQADTEIAKTRGAFNPLFLFCFRYKMRSS
jgi:hypothetical protein